VKTDKTQKGMGIAIAESIKAGVVKRDELFITSKIDIPNFSGATMPTRLVRLSARMCAFVRLSSLPAPFSRPALLRVSDSAFPDQRIGRTRFRCQ
jgi:hypothetical protein